MKKWFLASLSVLAFSALSHAREDRTMTLQHLTGGQSYFQISVQDDGLLNGSYAGWCADWAQLIQDGTYPAKFYSSYSSQLPEGLVDKPQNLDSVNWLINQHVVGADSEAGGTFTSGDLQLAIWTLLDDVFDAGTVGPYSQARVDELVAMALLEGEGFEPNCKQHIGIILKPGSIEEDIQTTIIEVPTIKFPKCIVPEGEEGLL